MYKLSKILAFAIIIFIVYMFSNVERFEIQTNNNLRRDFDGIVDALFRSVPMNSRIFKGLVGNNVKHVALSNDPFNPNTFFNVVKTAIFRLNKGNDSTKSDSICPFASLNINCADSAKKTFTLSFTLRNDPINYETDAATFDKLVEAWKNLQRIPGFGKCDQMIDYSATSLTSEFAQFKTTIENLLKMENDRATDVSVDRLVIERTVPAPIWSIGKDECRSISRTKTATH